MPETNRARSLSDPISRRHALRFGGAALAGAAALMSGATAAPAEDPHANHDHQGHDHQGHGHGEHAGHGKTDSQHQAVIDAATDCVAKGEACVAFCVAGLEKGDKSLAECLESVLGMMPLCTAVARLAALDAPRLKDAAKLCADVCADCEKVCRKHEKHHAVCKACADACAAFIKEARKLTGA